MKKNEINKWQDRVSKILADASIVITNSEIRKIEIADFGLDRFEEIGLSILTYVNTDRVCAKELVMLPNQICPEHRHPNIENELGKEETFRCRKGKVYLYVSSDEKHTNEEEIKKQVSTTVTVYKCIVLDEGKQYTIYPNTKHWFKAGSEGAIVSEFSTTSTDELDVFTDSLIVR